MAEHKEGEAWVEKKDNVATVSIPAGADVTIRVKTNSGLTQRVTVRNKDEVVNEFKGLGERNTVVGEIKLPPTEKDTVYTATFEYSVSAESEEAVTFVASKGLNTGGPYDCGRYRVVIIVAENGDDNDYNDSILEFNWNQKK